MEPIPQAQARILERIAHIDTTIDDIRGALAGQTKASFTDNMMLRLAVERLLEIISEASRHIPVDMKAKEPNIHWRRLADLGNWLRHAYHRTDMIENDLEPLKIFVRRIVSSRQLVEGVTRLFIADERRITLR